MSQLTFIEKIALYFSCFLLGFGLHAQLTSPQIILEENISLLENDNKKVAQEELLKHNNYLANIFKPQNEIIKSLFYEQIKPLEETTTMDDMKVYHVYLGQNATMKDALGWLGHYFKDKTFKSTFTYALYNNQINDKMIEFNYRIKEPPPQGFLLAYFEGGTRAGKNDTYTLEDLKQMGQGAKALYYLWATHPPLSNKPNDNLPAIPFEPTNYKLEIFYDKGTNFGGPSYLAIDKIALKDIRNQKIVAIYPINQKIEEPFVIFNYDFELKFPYYNYVQEGMIWNTNHIKSLRKIDLYEKRTNQKRTLYYDVE
ncbi:MAG: putative secreted protein [Candidatus Phytoplasma pruni]|uniref:hypothetical protein n=1 Tax=Poinsettia branch-inducing phytoplasma TaxID=138647 RepID=UPI00036899BB|nr:hypothetical protein [Poinsettia branch-inducing phytoplasma]WEK82618.1 MAG: putative secreted protein [Candidatus Phytoplasma pruni]